MRKYLKLSAIVLLTTAVGVLPASALSLNLGGGSGPLIDLGNDNNADATLGIDTGNLLGGSGGEDDGASVDGGVTVNLSNVLGSGGGEGGLLDLGGTGNVLDLGGTNGLIDLDGNGPLLNLGNDDDAALLNLGGSGDLLDLGGTGNVLDLGGEGGLLDLGAGFLDLGDGAVDLALLGDDDVIDLSSTGGIGAGRLIDLDGTDPLLNLGADDNEALLNLGSTDDLLDLGNGGLLDLGGTDELVAANVLGTDISADVLNGDSIADINIGTGNGGLLGTGLLGGTDVNVAIGGGSGGAGGGGTGGGGNGGNGGNGGGGGNGGSGGSLIAAAGDDACLSLSANELKQLVNRHNYSRATFNSWASASQLKVVKVDLCEGQMEKVAMSVGGDANIARLQAFLAAQAKVSAALQSQGYSPSDVIAADHDGSVLIVYVI